MALPNALLRTAPVLTIVSACVADDGNAFPINSANSDGTESSGDTLADTDAPDPDHDPFLGAIDRVEFSSSDGTRIEILVYNSDDQLIGTLALQHQGIENVQFVADFADGSALVEVDHDSVSMRYSDLPDIVVARRVEAVGLEIDSGAQEGWLKCAVMTAATIHNCWNPAFALWMCGASSFLTACECLDYLADKYGWMHDEC